MAPFLECDRHRVELHHHGVERQWESMELSQQNLNPAMVGTEDAASLCPRVRELYGLTGLKLGSFC
jgi:hypothetical protein